MTPKIRPLFIALALSLLFVQCTNDKDNTPNYPTSIDPYFNAGEFAYDGVTLKYQESTVRGITNENPPLVVVLHGQNSVGSDNLKHIRHDAMIRIWHHFSSKQIGAVLLAPQCSSRRAWNEISDDVEGATMAEIVKAFVDNYVANHSSIDASRIYILGYADNALPAGAGGVWRLLSDYSDTFAAGMAVSAEPDDTISAANVAKTPALLVKGEVRVGTEDGVMLLTDTFGDMVRDAGGVFKEVTLQVRSREEICRDAFSAENLDWVLQYRKNSFRNLIFTTAEVLKALRLLFR